MGGIAMSMRSLAAVVCFAGALAAAAETVVWTEDFSRFEKWRLSGPETLAAALDTEFSQGETCVKYTFKVDDPAAGFAWPQHIRYFEPAVPLEGNDGYLEFDAYYKPVRGEMKLAISLKEMPEVKSPLFKLVPNAWTHVKVPLVGKKPGAKLKGYAFVIGRRSAKAGSEAVFYIKNLRVVRGDKFEVRPVSALGPGILSRKVVPAAGREKDTRLEIEIPNLVNNAYFRMGGKDFPPPGWFSYGVGSYGESLHDGRSVRLPGAARRAVGLRQGGIVLVPGERYRLSGYIRGGGFTGKMAGQIVVAGPAWSKARGYFFSDKDIKPEWQYFEVVFTPEPSKSGEYEAIIYRSGAGGGWIEVDRVILEGLGEKALKNSRNKYADDTFDADYAETLKKGAFRDGPPSPDYTLVWSEEFDGDKIDTAKWKVYEMSSKRPYRHAPSAVKLDGKGHACFTTSLAADGKKTVDGGRTRQGMIFRGSDMNLSFKITQEGIRFMRDELGIRTDLDLRYPEQTARFEASPLGADVRWIRRPVNAYKGFTPEQNDLFRDTIKVFADPANYPIYLHCAAGVDRTGEVVFLLDMLLGVEEERAFLDYEASSLAYYPRPRTISYFSNWLKTIGKMSPEGTPRRQQVVNYLMKIGVTGDEIAAIRKIMLEPGNQARKEVSK